MFWHTPAWLTRQAIKQAKKNNWAFSWVDIRRHHHDDCPICPYGECNGYDITHA